MQYDFSLKYFQKKRVFSLNLSLKTFLNANSMLIVYIYTSKIRHEKHFLTKKIL